MHNHNHNQRVAAHLLVLAFTILTLALIANGHAAYVWRYYFG